jgi:hypothetical protein
MEDATRIFGDAQALEEWLGRLVSEIFDFYERGEPPTWKSALGSASFRRCRPGRRG